MDYKIMSSMALKKQKATLVLKNANVINVFNHSIQKGDIAIHDSLILGIGEYDGLTEIDCTGLYAAPGFIDSHVHIESSMLTPCQYARAVMPRGTTTVIADPHEIANVCGTTGIKFMMTQAKFSPLDVHMMMPSCVPSTPYETSGHTLLAQDIALFEKSNPCFGLGEVMDYPKVISGDESIYQKIELFEDRPKDGHLPLISHDLLNSYLLSGIQTDHESSTKAEMLEKVEKGMYVLLREGSATKNVLALAPYIQESFSHRLLFCSDDLHPKDIEKNGHINHNINLATSAGVDPITAIQMATINAASAYHLQRVGGIAPGYYADIVLFKDLRQIEPVLVYKKGVAVSNKKEALFEDFHYVTPEVLHTVNLSSEKPNFQIPLKSDIVHVIGFEKNNVTTTNLKRKVRVENGYYVQEKDSNILKLMIVERHHGSGRIGKALIEGYGLKDGAIALTIAHDSHNLVILGDNDLDMGLALDEIRRIQGGIALVKNGRVLDSLELEVAGLMTEKPASMVRQKLENMDRLIREMGVTQEIDDPFLNLAFLSLPVIPSLKCSDFGLFDVEKFKLIPLEWEEV